MARVAVDARAPDFELADFTGEVVRLKDFTERDGRHVVLVFNRGFL